MRHVRALHELVWVFLSTLGWRMGTGVTSSQMNFLEPFIFFKK